MRSPEPFGPYIHLGPADKLLWTRFLELGGSALAPFTYDLRVGEGLQMPPGSSQLEIQIAWVETTKRIDVASLEREPAILFEVKPRASTTALGQLITYGDLWHRENLNRQPPTLMLITDLLAPDMSYVLQRAGILTVELERVDSPLRF